MKFEVKRQMIQEAGQKIKEFGFRVFIFDKDGFIFLFFTNDLGKRVGYVQVIETIRNNELSGLYEMLTYSSPGFSVDKAVEVTKEACQRALTMYAPGWYSGGAPYFKKLDDLMKAYKDREGFYEL